MATRVTLRIATASGSVMTKVLEDYGKDIVLLGRGEYHGHDEKCPKNDIAMPRSESSISRAHLTFERRADGWYLHNESDFGVASNGQYVTDCLITNGSRFVLSPNGSAYACIIDCTMEQAEENAGISRSGISRMQEIPETSGASATETQISTVPDVSGESKKPVNFDFDDDGGTINETFDRKKLLDLDMPAHSVKTKAETISLLEKERYAIGRSPECDIHLPHPLVSRQHAVIARQNGMLVLSDNHSTNGVMLNGNMLRAPQALSNGDRISIASYKMVFENGYLTLTESMGGVSLEAIDVCKAVKDSNRKKGAPADPTLPKGMKYITDHVSLSIKPGEFVAIIGGSGAGKSTIMNCLSGMTDYTSGQVLVDGEPLSMSSTNVRSIIGYVPQSDIVYDDLSLEHMLLYSARLRMPPDTSEEDIRAKIDETLAIVELSDHRKTMISKLSGGQRKRASMAVELMASPKLFFLDEPFSGLDPGTEKKLMAMLKKLSTTGKTVIMVTHSVQNIELCDRLVCMGRGGRLCYSGTPEAALDFFGAKTISDIYDGLDNHSAELAARFRQIASPSSAMVEVKGQKQKSASPKKSFRQFRILTARYAELTLNRRKRFILLLALPIILTLFVCIAFELNGGLWTTIGERASYPYAVALDTQSMLMTFACAAFWIGIFNSVQEISKERTIYNRECFTGLRQLPYLCSKTVINVVLCLLQSLIMVVLLATVSNYSFSLDGDMKTVPMPVMQEVAENGLPAQDEMSDRTPVITQWSDMKYYENNYRNTGRTSNNASVSLLHVETVHSGQIFHNVWIEIFLTCFLSMLSAMAIGLAISSAVSNDMALVLCPVALLPQILFSGVTTELQGITEFLSNFITCRWSTVGFATSLDINGSVTGHVMYNSLTISDGRWDLSAYIRTINRNKDVFMFKYDIEATNFLGLHYVQSSWVNIILIALGALAVAFLVLYLNGRDSAATSILNGRFKRKAR